jgi:D-alanyl-D-alanine carboxypeptidase
MASELFDRGFAESGGGVPLETLPTSSIAAPPDMRAEICSRRNRLAVVAAMAEEERIFAAGGAAAGAAPTPSAPMGRGGPVPAAVAAVAAPAPTAPPATAGARLTERVHFEPIPVFVGPKPGWTGPVLAARRTVDTPAEASAFTSEKSVPSEGAAEPSSAPVALQGAVHIPPRTRARAKIGHPITTTIARERRLTAIAAKRSLKKPSVN